MVSLRSSSKEGRDNQEVETDQPVSSPDPPARVCGDATERTRLLPQREHSDGYLNPNNPAVCCVSLFQRLF
jgi:hypothetical protein